MRLVIVSNRLPTIVAWEGQDMRFKGTAGGLTSGLSSWLAREGDQQPYVWIGWPGATVPEERQDEVRTRLREEHNAVPVFLSSDAMDHFYLGFCNSTIWPLFHYFASYVQWQPDTWESYRQVNEAFLAVLKAELQPGDVVWIHDYHLMLLPALIRRACPEVSVGFFLHIPFPSFEIFRLMPNRWRRAILEGLLGADLLGFHIHDYTEHFVQCVRRVLGYESHLGTISVGARQVRADTFPMGIDYAWYANLHQQPEVRREIHALRQTLQGLHTVLSVDRLDYSKGIPNRLRGFARFLEMHPSWHGRVCLAMVVVPSRIGVQRYDEMKRQIDEMVGEVNGRFGTVSWTPIRYQYRMLSAESLSALYAVSEVALVTPLRDGMNLVAKEYVAGRTDETGVLILSEMAGAASDLGEAVVVNPNSAEEMAEAILLALEMPAEEQIARNRAMQKRIRKHDVHWWANDFLTMLDTVHRHQEKLAVQPLAAHRDELFGAWQHAARRLLLLDYDGTLVDFRPHPDLASPGPDLIALLRRLVLDPYTRVAVLSGRSRESLDRWFGNLAIDLVAEHGAWERDASGRWTPPINVRSDWKADLRPFLDAAAQRLPGSFVEEKEFALVWHYRAANRELGSHRARELTDRLTSLVANTDIQVLPGHRVVELRNAQIHKGVAVTRLQAGTQADFVLVVGDDWTDEDMFRAVPERAWTVRVGAAASVARFTVASPAEVLTWLRDLADQPVMQRA